jgi:hypothetical protein
MLRRQSKDGREERRPDSGREEAVGDRSLDVGIGPVTTEADFLLGPAEHGGTRSAVPLVARDTAAGQEPAVEVRVHAGDGEGRRRRAERDEEDQRSW